MALVYNIDVAGEGQHGRERGIIQSGGEEENYSSTPYSKRGWKVTTSHPTTSITSTSLRTRAGSTRASNISMMEDRRTDPTTRHTFPKEHAEEPVAAGAEPVGSEKEPKEIIHAAGAAEEEAGGKVVEDGILSLEVNSPSFMARVLL